MTETAKKVLANMLCRARQCWEQGIAGVALYELGETALLLAAADDMITRQHADGRLCTVENTACQTDPALCIQSVMHAWQLTGEQLYLDAGRHSLAFYRATPWHGEDGIIYHICGTRQVWSDTAAMLPASLAMLGEREMALQQMQLLCDRLRLPSGLYGHIWDDGTQSWPDPLPWSAGNGWVLTGLAWMIILLDRNAPESAQLMQLYQDLTAALAPWRTAEGLYHNVADDASTFVECQTAAMQAYSQVLLCEHGLLDRSVLAQARQILDEITRHIDAHGAVHDCPGSPTFSANGTSTEMQAFWLMLYGALERNQSCMEEGSYAFRMA